MSLGPIHRCIFAFAAAAAMAGACARPSVASESADVIPASFGACTCGDPVSHCGGGECGLASGCALCSGYGTGGAGYCGDWVSAAGGCASGFEMMWFRADYLLMQRDGVNLPPLATASPVGTPANSQGILGLPSTSIVGGDLEASDGWRSGFALEFGYWLNPMTGWAIAADYFNGGRESYGFTLDSTDGRILARPFLNAQSGQQNARILNLPGELVGGVAASVFDDFQGAGFWMQRCVWERGSACSPAGGSRINLLGGYRYYHQDSLVYIREDYVALAGNSFGRPAGEVHLAADKFAGRNEFHGFELGLQGRVQRCRWWCEGLAAIALGGSRRVVFVEGSTINVAPLFVPSFEQGALLTSGVTNFGRYTDDRAQAIPRFRLGAGWQITEKLSARAGYNVIIWNGVAQAANHLPDDLATDPRNLPTVQAGGGPEPAFPGLRDTTMVAHGVDFGLELWF